MRKYIHIAKCLKPKLSEAACEAISNEYSRLRSQDITEADVARTQPVTARTLETLIRLSTAHAKARLGKSVSVRDAHAAIELVQYAYFKKVLEKEKKKRRRSADSNSEDEHESDIQTQTPSRSKRTRTGAVDDDEEQIDDHIETPIDSGDLTRRTTKIATKTPSNLQSDTQQSTEEMSVDETISEERFQQFEHKVQLAFRQTRDQTLSLERLTTFVNQDQAEIFTSGEISAAISRMTDANKVMMADDMVFLI